MKINLDTCRPWPEINGTLRNARTLKVVADGKEHTGEADLTIDEFGNVTLTVGKAKRVRK